MHLCTSLFVVLVCCASCAQETRQATVAVQPAVSGSEATDSSLTKQEKDFIRKQVQENWIVDIGMAGLETMAVRIDVEMNPDGSVQVARIDPATDNGNPNWREYAEMCRRAVLKSSPLRIPADKPYAVWKHMTLIFDAHDLAGQ